MRFGERGGSGTTSFRGPALWFVCKYNPIFPRRCRHQRIQVASRRGQFSFIAGIAGPNVRKPIRPPHQATRISPRATRFFCSITSCRPVEKIERQWTKVEHSVTRPSWRPRWPPSTAETPAGSLAQRRSRPLSSRRTIVACLFSMPPPEPLGSGPPGPLLSAGVLWQRHHRFRNFPAAFSSAGGRFKPSLSLIVRMMKLDRTSLTPGIRRSWSKTMSE